MARPLRLEYPGALWFVTSRSEDRRGLFRDDADREEFLDVVRRVVGMFRWKVLAYALLDDRYELLIETPEPNLSRGMRQLNGTYTQHINARYRRNGSLIQGRFRGVLVQRGPHLLEMLRLMAWRPVLAGAARGPAEFKWSSYRVTLGMAEAPAWLDTGAVLGLFGKSPARAKDAYRSFIADGKKSTYDPEEHIQRQLYLGEKEFPTEVEKLARSFRRGAGGMLKIKKSERPDAKTIVDAVSDEFGISSDDLRRGRRGEGRKALALIARREGAMTLPEIGKLLGIGDWSTSHLATEGERLITDDPEFKKRVEKVVRKLKSAR